MDITIFIQDSLKIVWVILGLSALILILGWILSRWIAKAVISLLNRVPIVRFVVNRLKLPDIESINHRLEQITRALIILLTLWGVWKTLNSHPEISGFIADTWQAIVTFVQLPVVTFIFDLALIGLETFILFKAFGWVKAGFNIIAHRIAAEQNKRLKGFKIQRVHIFTASQLTKFLLGISKYTRYGVNIVLILIYLTGIFSVFPQTRGAVTNILTDVFQAVGKSWQGIVDYLPSLLNLAVIIVITYYGLKVIRFIFGEIEKGTISFIGFHPEWAITTYQLTRFLVIALALVIAFPYLPGSSSPAFQGVSVFIGILFSLGSTSIVANIVSGVVLTYARAFSVGDRVKIADTVGDVIEKGLLVTRVRTIKNVDITIPNGMVMGSHIINYSAVSQEQGLILNTTITLGYDISWRLIHETLIKAAQATTGILAEPRPFVLQTSLDDYYVSYELNAYSDQPNKMAVIYSELHQNIQDFCNEAGIEILSPRYDALRDGNQSTIPSEHLPKDYQAPPFVVRAKDDKK
jgi:small-conductance mechanosensitive channel